MASPNIYAGGLNLAGTVFANGPTTLQRGGPVYFSGGIQWLDTIDGNDANAGALPELPVKTLAQAVTNSAANGAIIIGEGSSESLSSSQAFALAGLSIFGCGTGCSRPRYTCTGAVSMWNLSAAGAWVEGFYFPATTVAGTCRVLMAADNQNVHDCYFECGTNDTNSGLIVNGNTSRIGGCSFVVTASRPAIGLHIVTTTTDATIEDCVFDGGSYGWTDYALKAAGASTRTTILGGTFINRSDIGFTSTGTSYKIFGPTMDGTSRVLLTA